MAGDFDPYYTWLGIPPEEQPPHHYRLLGIRALEGNADVIQNAADRIMAQLRTYQAGHHSAESQKLLNEVATARVCLLNPDKKAAYDAALRQRLAPQQAVQVSPAPDSIDASLIGLSEATPHLVPHPLAQHRPTAAVPIHQRPWFVPAAIAAGTGCLVLVVLAGVLVRRGPSPPVQVADETPPPEVVLKSYTPPTLPAAPASPKQETATPTPPPTPPAPDKTQETIAKPSPETLPAPVASTATLPAQVSPPATSTSPSSPGVASPSAQSGVGVPPSDSPDFVGHTITPFYIDSSPDGKRMMSAPLGFRAWRMKTDQTRETWYDSLRIWDTQTKRCLTELSQISGGYC